MVQEATSVAVQGVFGRVAIYSTARALVEHAHQEFNFIFHAGGADSGFTVGSQRYELSADTALLVNPWLPHSKLANSTELPTEVLTVLPNSAWLAQSLGMADMPLVRLFGQPDVVVGPALKRCVDRLAMGMRAGAALFDQQCEPLVAELVKELAEHYADASLREGFHRGNRPMDARVMKSLALIRARARENPNLEGIASEVGLSRSRFFEQFKTCVGVPPQQYLDWARMAVATELLACGKQSLAEISDELGFAAPSHFARFFTQHMGVPPSDYRRGVIVEELPAGSA